MSSKFDVQNKEFLKDRVYYQDAPRHVLLLPDGSRRYAQRHNLAPDESYDVGQKICAEFYKLCLQKLKLNNSSIFFLRPESFDQQRRTEDNLNAILIAITKLADSILDGSSGIDTSIIGFKATTLAGRPWMDKPIRITNSSRISESWDRLRMSLEKLESESKNTDRVGFFLINYSGSTELEQLIKGNLQSNEAVPPIGLLIRTGESMRLSDCPLHSLATAHIHLIPKFLPEVSTQEFENVIRTYLPINGSGQQYL